ncbi:MAG: M28 family peptidase [Sphingobacteriales bacterium]|nr:M28 family peptidase [Sphingobacteriales bacterium]
MPLSFLLFGWLALAAQSKDANPIAQVLTDDQILAPLQYLASDHLRGRHIGLPEIDTAAEYIADQFRRAGTKTVPGQDGYYQVFNHQFSPMNRSRMDRQVAANIPWTRIRGVTLKNILAYVPGTDPILNSQYIILSAHYDHVGVADSAVMENGKMDSIFNGARDNATGAAAVVAAARYFARHPPKRSILFICYTAEEEPKWTKGDPYEKVWQTLFGKNQ